jgi:hypothetical protein
MPTATPAAASRPIPDLVYMMFSLRGPVAEGPQPTSLHPASQPRFVSV